MNWEQEKAYCRRRAQELFAEMEKATERKDKEAFEVAYRKAMRYAAKRELAPYYKRFLVVMSGRA